MMESDKAEGVVEMAQVISTGAGGAGLVAIAQLLGSQTEIHVRQKVNGLEAVSGGCCEVKNTYIITAGNDGNGQQLLEAKEASACIDRHCCKPVHSRSLYVYPPGAGKEQSLLTIDHPGCECICCSAARPGVGVGGACLDCCTDGVNVYDGYVEGKPGSLSGNLISSVKQPVMGGGCTPTLVVDGKAYVEGPSAFGGWSECCFDSTFTLSTQPGKSGDIATFKHLKPKDFGGAVREACTDSDNYGITFTPATTAEQKADALASAILVDYM